MVELLICSRYDVVCLMDDKETVKTLQDIRCGWKPEMAKVGLLFIFTMYAWGPPLILYHIILQLMSYTT